MSSNQTMTALMKSPTWQEELFAARSRKSCLGKEIRGFPTPNCMGRAIRAVDTFCSHGAPHVALFFSVIPSLSWSCSNGPKNPNVEYGGFLCEEGIGHPPQAYLGTSLSQTSRHPCPSGMLGIVGLGLSVWVLDF